MTMSYGAALAAVEQPAPANYLKIQISYGTSVILPHEAGMQFLASLREAEFYDASYRSDKGITPLPDNVFQVSHMNREEYCRLRMATLMNITPDELDQIQKQRNEQAAA